MKILTIIVTLFTLVTAPGCSPDNSKKPFTPKRDSNKANDVAEKGSLKGNAMSNYTKISIAEYNALKESLISNINQIHKGTYNLKSITTFFEVTDSSDDSLSIYTTLKLDPNDKDKLFQKHYVIGGEESIDLDYMQITTQLFNSLIVNDNGSLDFTSNTDVLMFNLKTTKDNVSTDVSEQAEELKLTDTINIAAVSKEDLAKDSLLNLSTYFAKNETIKKIGYSGTYYDDDTLLTVMIQKDDKNSFTMSMGFTNDTTGVIKNLHLYYTTKDKLSNTNSKTKVGNRRQRAEADARNENP